MKKLELTQDEYNTLLNKSIKENVFEKITFRRVLGVIVAVIPMYIAKTLGYV